MKTPTSQRSKSPRVKQPVICDATQSSPVFSCASAFDRYAEPSTARVDRA